MSFPPFVAHGVETGTQEVAVYHCQSLAGPDIYLIDTPGFDDVNRSDVDVLRAIAKWLAESYSYEIKLNGVIWFGRITDTRVGSLDLRHMRMFEALCGKDYLKNVVLGTTMWDIVDEKVGSTREAQLLDVSTFWGWMYKHGAKVVRHTNDVPCARKILGMFLPQQSAVLDIQKEIIMENRNLVDTTAGREVDRALASTRVQYEQRLTELREIRERLEKSSKAEDRALGMQLAHESDELIRQIQQLQAQVGRLNDDMDLNLMTTDDGHRAFDFSMEQFNVEHDVDEHHSIGNNTEERKEFGHDMGEQHHIGRKVAYSFPRRVYRKLTRKHPISVRSPE